MKKKYCFLHRPDEDALGVAYAEEGYDFDFLSENQYYENWKPVTFTLRDGDYADYQANDLGWLLCSKKLRDIIQQGASPNDTIQWLQANVIGPEDTQRTYYILHLPKGLDVLDKEKTIFAGDFAVKPHLNSQAIYDHRVFRYQGSLLNLIISAEVRDAIVSAGCTGIGFYKALAT